MASAVPPARGRAIRRTPGDLEAYSQLTGRVEPAPTGPYRVRFRSLTRTDGVGGLIKRIVIALLTITIEVIFVRWLLSPEHYPSFAGAAWLVWTNIFVIVAIAIMELFRLVNTVSLAIASVLARDPVPVRPDPSLRLAFLTTIVPSREPIAVVAETLRAARRIDYAGQLDVWLLDEGNDPDVIAVCAELGVRHFSRRGIERYNTRKGPFRARTKHGNYNAWLDAHGDGYDVFLSVDPDHVPLPNFVERVLGYFRDPDVAYVVGPQCYRNSTAYVTRGAESQQFPFHGIIQRAANRYHAAMLVGTNNAIRISALRGVGGLSDSITEDMATGIRIHTSRNPATRRRWKSIYTPDVLAAGEGPESWRDYFGQQMRWSRGTFEILTRMYWRRVWRFTPGQLLHYSLITTFYPSMALGWLLGGINAVLYLAVGAHGPTVSPSVWLALYTDATIFQLWLYVSARRHNVSPYEVAGSTGLGGMLMSVISAPIYSSQLIATLLFRPARFVVTPKGTSRSRDSIWVFRRHLQWAALLTAALAVAVYRGHADVAVTVWPSVNLLICLAPLLLWRMEFLRNKRLARQAQAATPAPADALDDDLPGLDTSSFEIPAFGQPHFELPTGAPPALASAAAAPAGLGVPSAVAVGTTGGTDPVMLVTSANLGTPGQRP
ncbi:cellulose synthase catalytic subunit, partial [Luedemannella flava]|uniref:glycosyltransferase family 2 protein n=1 Tax=Luedemannella flava TaxID=349316 RepID=UPI0031DD1A34